MCGKKTGPGWQEYNFPEFATAAPHRLAPRMNPPDRYRGVSASWGAQKRHVTPVRENAGCRPLCRTLFNRQLRANRFLMQRSKQHPISITSSARASNFQSRRQLSRTVSVASHPASARSSLSRSGQCGRPAVPIGSIHPRCEAMRSRGCAIRESCTLASPGPVSFRTRERMM